MQTAIGVRFKKVGRIEYYRPGFSSIRNGDWVIAETERGLECGRVVIGPGEIASDELHLRSVRRRATPNDLLKYADNKRREQEAFLICKQKIEEHNLPMKLISVEFTFDVNKIIFSFTAEGRVDFRELVRDLAYVFRTRIELRQVGIRDETKLMGGIGHCGRPLCCANFLGDFTAVSIRMAKEQNLSLNPTKISGCCGRLMCCLEYEDNNYRDGCILCGREPTIDNLNADEDSVAAEKLEQLDRADENMETIDSEKPVEVRKPVESRTFGGNRNAPGRRSRDNRNADRSERNEYPDRNDRPERKERYERRQPNSAQANANRNHPLERNSTSGNHRPMRSTSPESPPNEQGKKPPQKNKPRPKKSAYQRDKKFHSRRPNLDDA